VVIEDEGNASLGEERDEDFCRSENFMLRKTLGTELKNSCPTICKLGGE
jgi:hypothetical protein